jgi:hypothetical protein
MVKRLPVVQMPVQLPAMLMTAVLGIPFAVCLAAAFPVVLAWRGASALLRHSI